MFSRLLLLSLFFEVGIFEDDSSRDTPPTCGRNAVLNRRYLKRSVDRENSFVGEPQKKQTHVSFIASIQTFDLTQQPDEFVARVDLGASVGTILAPRLVLSACRCFALHMGNVGRGAPTSIREAEQFGILAGTPYDRSPNRGIRGQLRFAWKIIVHPECELRESVYLYDLAVLIVKKPFEIIFDLVQPLPIKSSAEIDEYIKNTTTVCYALGWGWAWRTHKFDVALTERYYAVKVEELKLCPRDSKTLDNVPSETLLCVKSLADSLLYKVTGDIGSPIICTLETLDIKYLTMVGLKSSEDNSTFEGLALYSRLDPYADWLQQLIRSPPPPERRTGAAVTIYLVPSEAKILILAVVLNTKLFL